MKCPICQTELVFEKFPGIALIAGKAFTHEVRCGAIPEGWHFYALQNEFDPNHITYTINLEMDNDSYNWQSSYSSKSTRIVIVNKFLEDPPRRTSRLATLSQYYPLKDSAQEYEQIIRRILNLKAFL